MKAWKEIATRALKVLNENKETISNVIASLLDIGIQRLIEKLEASEQQDIQRKEVISQKESKQEQPRFVLLAVGDLAKRELYVKEGIKICEHGPFRGRIRSKNGVMAYKLDAMNFATTVNNVKGSYMGLVMQFPESDIYLVPVYSSNVEKENKDVAWSKVWYTKYTDIQLISPETIEEKLRELISSE